MSQLIVSSAQAAASGLGRAVASGVANAAASFAMTNAESILFGPVKRRNTGPRVESFQLQSSTQGAGIAQIFGQARLAGQLIWASNFLETNRTTTSRQGGKASRNTETTTTEFFYSISFAVALCEGVIDRIGTVWADGHPIDLSNYETRLYRGTEDQLPDPLIEQIEGDAPAYRGLAYIVFEDLPLAEFGNRIPQLKFEIERSLKNDDPTHLENAIQAVTLIPGSGEFIYGTTPVQRLPEEGVSRPENTHGQADISDIEASLDHLQQSLPNLTSVSLVVSWFGTDLRAGECEIKPGVERREKITTPDLWAVENLTRDTAHLISTRDGHAAYGGTPSDTGGYEIVQFRGAQLLGDGRWMLSGFLRGLAGSEAEAMAGASDGARVVVLETTDTVAFGLDSRGLNIQWQAGPADQAPGGAAFTPFTASFDGISRRPLSPVHLRAGRQGSDVSLSWVRRTRIGGDSWNAPEVPLGETQERYQVTISGSGSPRIYEVDRSDWVYSAAAQALDGNANAGFSVTIAQISDSFGPGAAASIAVPPL